MEQETSVCKQLSEVANALSTSLGNLITNPNREVLGLCQDNFEKYKELYASIPGDVAAQIGMQNTMINMQFPQLIGYANNSPALFAQLGTTIIQMLQSSLLTVASVCKDK